MSMNRELMRKTILELKENNKFQNAETKLGRCKKLNDVAFFGDIATTGSLVGGAIAMGCGIYDVMANSGAVNDETLIAGTGVFCASLIANAIIKKVQGKIQEAKENAEDCVYHNIRKQYVENVNEALDGSGMQYNYFDYENDMAEYVAETEKEFDANDFVMGLDD